MMLRLTDISKHYFVGSSRLQVLKNVNLEIHPGDRVWVSGKNGIGKTTLLKIISGELIPDSGKILPLKPDIKISLLSQAISDYVGKSLTVVEHIALGMGMGMGKFFKKLVTPDLETSVRERLSELELGLEKRLHDFVGNLSGGEAQVIGIFTVIQSEPDILCLDEPSASLDFRISSIIGDLLKKITESKKTALVFVTHDRDFASELMTEEVRLG